MCASYSLEFDNRDLSLHQVFYHLFLFWGKQHQKSFSSFFISTSTGKIDIGKFIALYHTWSYTYLQVQGKLASVDSLHYVTLEVIQKTLIVMIHCIHVLSQTKFWIVLYMWIFLIHFISVMYEHISGIFFIALCYLSLMKIPYYHVSVIDCIWQWLV